MKIQLDPNNNQYFTKIVHFLYCGTGNAPPYQIENKKELINPSFHSIYFDS